jgi:hypothetical protein
VSFELDHLFVMTDRGAPAAETLRAAGFVEGAPNVHPGQGSANRRFFFANAMLELLWVDDEREARSALATPTRLWERWSGRAGGACPFGIVLRPAGRAAPAPPPPFSAWEYRPPYLPPGLSLAIAENVDDLAEPMLLYFAAGRRADERPLAERPPIVHPAGAREIQRLRLVRPSGAPPSAALAAVVAAGRSPRHAARFAREGREGRAGLLDLETGPAHLVELGLDGPARRRVVDLRPGLPLVVRW